MKRLILIILLSLMAGGIATGQIRYRKGSFDTLAVNTLDKLILSDRTRFLKQLYADTMSSDLGAVLLSDSLRITGYGFLNNIQAHSGGMVAVRDTFRTTLKAGIGSATSTIDSMLTIFGGGHFTGGLKVDGVAQFGTYTGQTSITTLGTIGTGIWQGTAIDTTYLNAVSNVVSLNDFLTIATAGKTKRLTVDTTKYATSSLSGFLKYSDWVTFNNKVSSVSSGNSFITIGGTATNPTVASDTTKLATNSASGFQSFSDRARLANTSGTNTGDVTLAGTPDYITITNQIITRGLIDLATDVTGDLPYANLTQASGASLLLGRGSAAGAGDWQEITLGSGLTMSGTTLSANVVGSAGGWTNFTPRVYTTNVGDTVSVRSAAGDTLGNGLVGLGLLNVYGPLWVSGTISSSGLTASRLVATDANKGLVSTITAANLLSSVTGTTGTGNLVFSNTPTLTTPNIGAATGTSVNLTGTGTFGGNIQTSGGTVNNTIGLDLAYSSSAARFTTPSHMVFMIDADNNESDRKFFWRHDALSTDLMTLDETGSLSVTGAGTFGGDVAVNGGDLTSSATTFNLLNSTVTTLNVGGAATAINVGSASGTIIHPGQIRADSAFVLKERSDVILTPAAGFGKLYEKTDGKIYFKNDGGTEYDLTAGGGGITSLNGLTASSQTFADVDDTNVTLAINSATSTHTFTLGWTGTLAVARGGTGAGTLTGILQGNGTSAVTTITNSSTVGQVLRVTGASTYAWGALDLADGDAITGDLPYANLTPSANASRLLGRTSASAGDWQEISLGTSLVMNTTTLERAALTGDVTASQNSNSTTIANDAVTNAKLANMATQTFKGRNTAGTGDPEDLSIATAKTMLNNGIATEGNGFAGIIDYAAGTSAAAVGTTAMSNTTATALYRVSVYLETVTATNGSASMTLHWSASGGPSKTETTSSIDLSVDGAYTYRVFVVEHSGAGSTPLQYSTSYSGTGSYRWVIVTERLAP